MTTSLRLPAVAQSPPGRKHAWRERWVRFRNSLLGSPGFRAWATAFLPTRPIARRQARALFDLVAGFVYSQVLSACVSVGLFDLLAGPPQSIAALAPRLGLDEAATERLLKAAAALELTENLGDGRYTLGPLGAALQGNPGIVAMIDHHAILYRDLADPVALLRREIDPELARFWAYATSPDPAAATPDSVRAYSALMAVSQTLVAQEILAAYPIGRHRRLLDIGGGEGAFLCAAAGRAARLQLVLFDLPAVVDRAVRRFAEAGLEGRAQIVGGNFLTDALPTGADIVSLVRVLHDHDDQAVLTVLRKAHDALPAGGVLLVAEPMSATPGARPIGDAYFGFYLEAMRSGRPRTADELANLIRAAGFNEIRLRPTHTPMLVSVMTASARAR